MRKIHGDSFLCPSGYRLIRRPGHHRASQGNCVYEHILVAEKALGFPLEEPHCVHHFNRIRDDNANRNLVICEDDDYHHILHVRHRVVDRGGDPNTDKICFDCQGLKKSSEFHSDKTRFDGLEAKCKACKKAYDAIRWSTAYRKAKMATVGVAK